MLHNEIEIKPQMQIKTLFGRGNEPKMFIFIGALLLVIVLALSFYSIRPSESMRKAAEALREQEEAEAQALREKEEAEANKKASEKANKKAKK